MHKLRYNWKQSQLHGSNYIYIYIYLELAYTFLNHRFLKYVMVSHYLYIHTYIHTYIYINMHTHRHTHTHTHTHTHIFMI